MNRCTALRSHRFFFQSFIQMIPTMTLQPVVAWLKILQFQHVPTSKYGCCEPELEAFFSHSSSFDEIIFLVKPSWCPLGFPIKELPIFQHPRFPTTTYASLTSTSALWCWCITPIAGKTGNCLIFRWMQDATLAVSTCRKSTTFVVDFPNYNLHL